MKLEMFALCDAATDYGGRLNMLGVFEGIAAPKVPVTRDRCSVVMRMRFEAAEEGKRELTVRFQNKRGDQLIPEMKAKFDVNMPRGRTSVAVNLVLNINKLRIEEFGEHEVALFVDGEKRSSIPLTVAQDIRHRIRGTMDN